MIALATPPASGHPQARPDEKLQKTIRISRTLRDLLETIALEKGISFNDLAQQLLTVGLLELSEGSVTVQGKPPGLEGGGPLSPDAVGVPIFLGLTPAPAPKPQPTESAKSQEIKTPEIKTAREPGPGLAPDSAPDPEQTPLVSLVTLSELLGVTSRCAQNWAHVKGEDPFPTPRSKLGKAFLYDRGLVLAWAYRTRGLYPGMIRGAPAPDSGAAGMGAEADASRARQREKEQRLARVLDAFSAEDRTEMVKRVADELFERLGLGGKRP